MSKKVKQPHIFLATPMYGGMCTGVFTQSLISTLSFFSERNVKISCAFMFNESLITRARNNLTQQFLEGDATHLLFMDADQQWQAHDLWNMLVSDKDIIVGMCPKKEINWHSVREAAIRGEQDLSKFTGSFVVNLLQGTESLVVPQHKPFEIAAGGTGMMLIKRRVFDKLKKHTPFFRNDMAHMPGGKPVHRYFTESIDSESGRLLSEDYHFCHAYRKIGGKVWAAPWCKIGHFGTYNFTGQLIETNEPTTAALQKEQNGRRSTKVAARARK
jgi:hypothetical protein